MNVLAIVLMIIAFVCLGGVVIYFINDYMKYKGTVSKEITDTNKSLDGEKNDRLSNLKYVVDQVNVVNDDIYNTMTNNIVATSSNVVIQKHTTDGIISGLGKFLNFNESTDPKSPSLNLLNLPGSATPNVSLMQHITATMGLTASQLHTGKNNVSFCSDDNRCISFPDTNGNTFITSLDPNGNVVLDTTVQVNSNIAFMNNDIAGIGGRISALNNNLILNSSSGNIGVGSSLTAPSAALHIQSQGSGNGFKVSLAGSAGDALLIDASGNMNVYKPIQIMSAGNVGIGTISSGTVGVGTGAVQGLTITAANVGITGNLFVSGDTSINGSTTVQNIGIQGSGTVGMGTTSRTL
jgi:hypothetical protein